MRFSPRKLVSLIFLLGMGTVFVSGNSDRKRDIVQQGGSLDTSYVFKGTFSYPVTGDSSFLCISDTYPVDGGCFVMTHAGGINDSMYSVSFGDTLPSILSTVRAEWVDHDQDGFDDLRFTFTVRYHQGRLGTVFLRIPGGEFSRPIRLEDIGSRLSDESVRSLNRH